MKRLFARRRYLHFDEPPSARDAEALVTDPKRVASWAFMPMLQWTIKVRKLKRDEDGSLRTRPKPRPICYAAHKDAAIYAYYGHLLSERYEAAVGALGISDCVTAFRERSGRCNIDFAMEAFEWIRKHGECVALAFDIKGFFDNLDHALLKAQWARVLDVARLEEDHFAVFCSLTRFAFVERDAVFEEFGINPHKPRAKGHKRICSPEEFRTRVRGKGLIQHNPNLAGHKGIPQGSPMSAVLSNIYLLDFDQAVAGQVQAVGGLYRRYCDDMLCVVPLDQAGRIEEFVAGEIGRAKLEIHGEKTKHHPFRLDGETLTVDEPLQYLGFTFEGSRTLLRTASVSRYYRRMRAGVRLAAQTKRKHDAIREQRGELKQPLKRRKLNIRYSYIGRHNFISYALRAARKMDEPAIRKQVKRHWKTLAAEIKKAQERTP